MQIYSILYDNKIMIRQNHRSMDRGVLESQFVRAIWLAGRIHVMQWLPSQLRKTNKQNPRIIENIRIYILEGQGDSGGPLQVIFVH